MSKNDANKKHYFSTISKEESKGVFNDAVENNVEFFLWEKGQTEKDLEEYNPVSFDNDSMCLRLKRKGGLLSGLTQSKLAGKEVFFRISQPGYQFFSTGQLEFDIKSSEYTLDCANDVYKSQQRSNYRLNASPLIKVQIKIEDAVFNGLDISAGGTSFYIEEDDKAKYPKQKTFEDCLLLFNRKQFDIPHLKVMGVFEDRDIEGNLTGKTKLGVAFIDLPKNIEEELFIHINSEARAEELTKKMQKMKS